MIYLFLLLYYQQLIKPLCCAQAFPFKTFYLVSSVLTSLSRENTIEVSVTLKKCRLAKVRHFISWEKQVFLVGFSLAFPTFPRESKNRLNTSLVKR